MTGWILQWCSAVRYGSRTGPGAADLQQRFAQRQQRLISQSCFSLLLLARLDAAHLFLFVRALLFFFKSRNSALNNVQKLFFFVVLQS